MTKIINQIFFTKGDEEAVNASKLNIIFPIWPPILVPIIPEDVVVHPEIDAKAVGQPPKIKGRLLTPEEGNGV